MPGEDGLQDLAVVEIDRRTCRPCSSATDSLQVGDAVVAIGNALGDRGQPDRHSGIVSGSAARSTISGTGAPRSTRSRPTPRSTPGNSGGPLVDVNGRVIGDQHRDRRPGIGEQHRLRDLDLVGRAAWSTRSRAGRTPRDRVHGRDDARRSPPSLRSSATSPISYRRVRRRRSSRRASGAARRRDEGRGDVIDSAATVSR